MSSTRGRKRRGAIAPVANSQRDNSFALESLPRHECLPLGVHPYNGLSPVLLWRAERMAAEFQLISPYQPAGDQPKAIAQLLEGYQQGKRFQCLLGATGTG